MKELKNIPKKYEWILNKFIDFKKTYYEFEIWENGNPAKSIANIRRSNITAMEKSIKSIIKRLKQ